MICNKFTSYLLINFENDKLFRNKSILQQYFYKQWLGTEFYTITLKVKLWLHYKYRCTKAVIVITNYKNHTENVAVHYSENLAD